MSLSQSIRGTWELISFALWPHPNEDPATVIYPMGPAPKGIHIFTPDGYISAQVLNPGQHDYQTPNPFGATEAEYAESSRRYMGWTGPFFIKESEDGNGAVLTFGVTVCDFPNSLGKTQERAVEIDMDGILVVRSLKGAPVKMEFRWKRMESSKKS